MLGNVSIWCLDLNGRQNPFLTRSSLGVRRQFPSLWARESGAVKHPERGPVSKKERTESVNVPFLFLLVFVLPWWLSPMLNLNLNLAQESLRGSGWLPSCHLWPTFHMHPKSRFTHQLLIIQLYEQFVFYVYLGNLLGNQFNLWIIREN